MSKDTRVYKFTLDHSQEQEIEMPKGAHILKGDNQHGKFNIWALVDVNETKMEKRKFIVVGTGHAVGMDLSKHNYIGTALFDNGSFVYHLFEIK